jgi:LysM repeat protein
MRHLIARLPVLGASLFILSFAHAEETPATQELRELRQAVQQQSKHIELLSQQVGQLMRALEGQKNSEVSGTMPNIGTVKPTPEPVTEAPRAEPVSKAEMAPTGPKHVVAKGETLTSIAKQYNIAIAELKNANKIENERKLQIGQILTVPTTITPETVDKKENP